MPSVYDLKPRFQSLLRPVIKRLAAAGFTANTVTILALIGSVAVGACAFPARTNPLLLLLLPGWLFVRMALNAIDGMMARELNMATALGAVLNELGDVISDLALYLPLAVVYPQARWDIVAFAVGAVLTEFSGVLGRALGASRHYEGPMGKSDRAFVVGSLGLITAFAPKAVVGWPWVFGAAAILTALTCLNRLRGALRDLRDQPNRGD
ncbi:MAG TPA: CDP-alcohol phosphatidyltransferase family protein [Blastocatellia bacterium]|nr:CDP-alcohol phosphatidyltransferase family protein [Blastocatellia bacterium]